MKKIILILTLGFFLMISVTVDAYSFGIGKIGNNQRPTAGEYGKVIEDNNGFYIGKDEHVVYLSFDCGYENGYTTSILDTLKEEDVKATFFITGHYLTSSTAIVNQMITDGHIVGNHTNKHGHFTKQSLEKTLADVKELEDMFYEKTGQRMSKLCRPPAGEFTKESLELLKNNGYIPSFWSLAYVDWYQDKFYGNDYSYNQVMKKMHNGAVILMHTVSKDNATDLGKIIRSLKSDGYEFRNLDEIKIKR